MDWDNKADRSGKAMDVYVTQHSLRLHPAQEALREKTFKHPWAIMLSSADQMQLVQLLMKSISAKKVIELGVFTGYGCLSMALALPEDGKVIGCDINDEYVSIGRPYWKQAGVEQKIDMHFGPAKETLDTLISDGTSGTFDLAFVDADKSGYDTYYEQLLKLLRPGGLIIFDNVFLGERVLQESPTGDTKAIKQFNKKLATDERVDVSMLRLGDGTTIVRKR